MKLKITLIILAGIFSGLLLSAQEIPVSLKKRNEIYFTFHIKNPTEINILTTLISIDNVKDKKVWAYANIRQYLNFLKLGYDITLLPAPGDGPGVEMNGHVMLSVRNEIMYTFVEIQNVCKQTILINRSIKKYFLI